MADAFDYCPALEEVWMPASLVKASQRVITSRSALRKVRVHPDNPAYASRDGVLFNRDFTVLILYPPEKNAKEYAVPDTVNRIESYAFKYCRHLECVTLPDSVKEMGEGVFWQCENLTSVRFPKDVHGIAGLMFGGCHSLEYFPLEQIRWIGKRAFSGCIHLQNPKFSEELTAIGESAFSGCSRITDVWLPKSLKTIEKGAFYGCVSLKGIRVAEESKYFREIQGVLFDVTGKRLVCCPAGYTAEEYMVPQGVDTIGDSAFGDCAKIGRILFPDTLRTIGECAFMGCDGISEIEFPQGVCSLKFLTLAGCKNLKKVTIPHSMTWFAGDVFRGSPVRTVYYRGTREEWLRRAEYDDSNLGVLAAGRFSIIHFQDEESQNSGT